MIYDKKIAFISDTHLGARGGSSIFRAYFREYWNTFFADLHSNGIKHVIHGGDFFDIRNQIYIEDMVYVINEFFPLLEKYDIKMIIIAGNHDVAYKNTNSVNSLELFKSSRNIDVVDKKPCLIDKSYFGQQICLVPWINKENYDETFEFLDKIQDNENTLVVGHFEIQNMAMYKGSICDHGLSPDFFKSFALVLSGHFHHSSVYANIRYLGSPFCLNWQDYNDWRGYHIYDTETRKIEQIETKHHIFHQMDVYAYEDFIKVPLEDVKKDVTGKYTRLVIHNRLEKVQLLDIQSIIQNCNPISLQVVDKSIINYKEEEVIENDDEEENEKATTEITTLGMVKKIAEKLAARERTISLLEEIFIEAEQLMVKGE